MNKNSKLVSKNIRRSRFRCADAASFIVEALERRTLLSVSIVSDYIGIDFKSSGGYVPPDTSGAAGPAAYVETVNQAIRLFPDKTTNSVSASAALSTFFFTTGGLSRADGGSGLSDPIVAYDEQIGRFIVGDQDVNFSSHVSKFDIAVSKTSTPGSLGTSDWTFYSITTTESGYDADYPGNFGYNHDAFVFTLNMFGVSSGGHTQVVSIDSAQLAAGGALTGVYKNDVNDFSLRPTTMHDSVAGDPMWMVTEHGNNTSIDVIKMGNPLSNSATFIYTALAVTPYSSVVTPKNPNGTTITSNIDSRILKSAEANNTIVATHSVGVSSTQDVVQWYAVDVSGATPTLKDQGRVSAGANTYLYYPGIDINPAGDIGMSFMRSGTVASVDYMSTWVTARAAGDPAGTMQTPVRSSAGTGQATYTDFASGHRAGDLSGINVDPIDGSFWAANEYANTETTANWGTAIVNFKVAGLLAADLAVTSTGPSSITAGTNATYTVTVTNNGANAALGLVLTDTLPAGSSYVSITQNTGTDAFTFGQGSGTVTATANGSIAAGSSDSFTIVVNAPTSLANGATFNNVAAVSASNPDPNSADNTATTTGSIVNVSANADPSIAATGPATGNEGDKVTYKIVVTNNGPATATGVSLVDTLGSLLNYQSATKTQGTFTQANGVVTFNLGTISAGATATVTIVAQAIEDGSTSSSATVSSTSADPTSSNNAGSTTTYFAEPPIVVSSPQHKRTSSLTNSQVATFTHASGIEPTSEFIATINWGDKTTSTGTITKTGTTYYVTGTHKYAKSAKYTITTTVVEKGLAVDKFGDEGGSRNWKKQDVVKLPGNSGKKLVASPFASSSTIIAPAADSTDDSILTVTWSPI